MLSPKTQSCGRTNAWFEPRTAKSRVAREDGLRPIRSIWIRIFLLAFFSFRVVAPDISVIVCFDLPQTWTRFAVFWCRNIVSDALLSLEARLSMQAQLRNTSKLDAQLWDFLSALKTFLMCTLSANARYDNYNWPPMSSVPSPVCVQGRFRPNSGEVGEFRQRRAIVCWRCAEHVKVVTSTKKPRYHLNETLPLLFHPCVIKEDYQIPTDVLLVGLKWCFCVRPSMST